MYKTIARRKARVSSRRSAVATGDAALADVADDVHHIFPGDNAVGGERHSREAMGRWFERLYRLIPDLNFEVKQRRRPRLAVGHAVAVEWRRPGQPPDGERLRSTRAPTGSAARGKATYIHALPRHREGDPGMRERLAAAGYRGSGGDADHLSRRSGEGGGRRGGAGRR